MATASFQTTPSPEEAAPARGATSNIRNRILSLLPPAELEEVLERCEMVTIESKELVFRREEPIGFVYFPEDCVISLVTEMEDGDSVEAMTVGSDGFAGSQRFTVLPTRGSKASARLPARLVG